MAAEYLEVHPDNPHGRQIRHVVQRLRQGAVIAYPTDSCYALGCHIGDKTALDRIRRIRELGKHHNMTLLCRDLSEIANYARVDNWQYRLLRQGTPGPYTFVLRATLQVPRRLHTGKRKTIGVRVPEHPIVQALLDELGEPLLSCTAHLPDAEIAFHEAEEIREAWGTQLDMILDGGASDMQPSSVVDLSDGEAQLLRRGKGDPAELGL